MQAIYDHIIAVLVGATVLLLVGTITRGSLEAAIGGNEHQVARAREVAMAGYLTQDLRNVGAAGAADPIVSGTDSTLEIEAPVQPGDSAATVRYERVTVAEHGGEPIYRVERYVDGTLTTEIGEVTGWRIYCLDVEGDTLSYGGTDYQTDTQTFAIEFEITPGVGRSTLGAGEATPRTWRTRVHPFHLND